jgi:hypothetical protein
VHEPETVERVERFDELPGMLVIAAIDRDIAHHYTFTNRDDVDGPQVATEAADF